MNELRKTILKYVTPLNVVRFYAVGLLLFALPFTREFFISITWLSLLLVLGVTFISHKKWDTKTILVFASIVILSFLLEMKGVETGKLFGEYQYDTALGLKLWNTPLLIGFNWLFLVYATAGIVAQCIEGKLWRILLGAVLMIMFDMAVELVAPAMQMWHFSTLYPPLINFVTWFVAALFFHTLIVISNINTQNEPARAIFVIQIVFFNLIAIYVHLFMQ